MATPTVNGDPHLSSPEESESEDEQVTCEGSEQRGRLQNVHFQNL